ncbi:prolyl-tRNA synthetase, family II [Rubidibacter lacunae KORDI 51-2]|uniref:Proline--tRNA ligase n=1 Tax=Rubidibacter lacunae KORDI 51-2 TaxID=582515 RepID=U5D516_9CHRO|nr:proline--tRNA ligase [Rubidibacter lacunae]ERN39773.1 prolyl-tRNA synthetase, family II [Rubidibacter lacunae KORDI 51-2]
MRLSQMLFVTLREDPVEAEIPSHKLLLRGGFIRRIGSGLYAYMPLMWRVLQKVSQIVREEMDAVGAQECLFTQLQPSELWKESGRWETYTKAEGIMFSLVDRQEREVGLGPTHEEVVTSIARDFIRSYRQLPQHLYQIQTKFRDEIRPRFGLMRGREFVMKDSYSFHTDEESLKATYAEMDRAYRNMFRRCGLAFIAVEADSGAIGGSKSQEFMVLADAGEDDVLYTSDGNYSANVEKADSIPPEAEPSPFSAYERVHTLGTSTIATMCDFLKCSPTAVVKNVLYEARYDNGKTVLVLANIRGDLDVNDTKLTNELSRRSGDYGATTLIGLDVPDEASQARWAAKPLPLGYLAPNLGDDYITKSETVVPQFLRLADKTVVDLKNFSTGANEANFHVVGANWGEQFELPAVVDIRTAQPGDRALHDPEQHLETARGIEVGHIFQLGTKYSQAMNATYTSEQGEDVPLWMGTYGVGVSRLAQSAVEQSYDKNGIIWPVAIAPYHAIVVVPVIGDADQVAAAEKIYSELTRVGVETLLDDRDVRAGVKFKDADLIGIPFRIVTGRSLKSGKVEIVRRQTGESQEIALEDVASTVKTWVDVELTNDLEPAPTADIR